MSSNSGGLPSQTRSRERGLPSLNDARRTRRRSIVLGRVRLREVATRFWVLTFIGMAVFGIFYYRYAQNQLTAQRNQLAARQRAVVAAAGSEGVALRDKLEAWVLQLGQGELTTFISPSASLEEISQGPGVYVRVLRSDARDVESLRRAAARSVHDGFSSCLFVGRAPQADAVACKTKAQCGPGELCDDWGRCAVPGQPYNLRLLYDALKIQGPDWDRRLASTGDELQVRAMELELEGASKHEVPAAAELIRRSKYFSAVLDEEPASALGFSGADAGAGESAEERVQATDHFVRIGIWDIARAQPLLRLRLPVAGRLMTLGQREVKDVEATRARQRQANNCSAAVEVREALISKLDPNELDGAEPQPAPSPPGR